MNEASLWRAGKFCINQMVSERDFMADYRNAPNGKTIAVKERIYQLSRKDGEQGLAPPRFAYGEATVLQSLDQSELKKD